MKKIFVNLLIFTVSLIAGIILLEFFIRIILPVYDPRGMLEYKYYPQDDTVLCIKNFLGHQWKNTGDYNVSMRINKYGFRDKKDLLDSTYNDIFVVGDSFALGWGVEENRRYSGVLESILGIPVYNIGVPAGDICDYQKSIDYARKNGAKIKNIILTLCMENDLRVYSVCRRHPAPRGVYRIGFSGIKEWLAKNAAIYNVFATIMHQNNALRDIAVKFGLIVDNYASIPINAYPDKVLYSVRNKLLELNRSFNAIIVLIPSRALWVGRYRESELEAHNRLVRLLRDSGMEVVDLRPYFEEVDNPLQYHFKNDGHWNESGHKKAAQVIAQFINKNKNGE